MEVNMVSNVKSKWVDGNLIFTDNSGNTVLKMDVENGVLESSFVIQSGPVKPRIPFTAAADLEAGDLIYISGWDATGNLPVMNKADADAADPAKCAEFVCDADVSQGAEGVAVTEKLITAQNTNGASAVGDPVYLGTTAGCWSLTAPTAGGTAKQKVGVVTVKSETEGAIMLYPTYSKVVTVNTTE